MKKLTFHKTDLACIMQAVEEITPNMCHNGVISRNEDGSFRFEESVRKGRAPRNPKLFDGKFISMVHMPNGRYQCHFKIMQRGFNRKKFAFGVFTEITTALHIID